MRTSNETTWITGEEVGREWRRLIEAGVPDGAPEFKELNGRILARDEYLYETYGKHYLKTHYGKWIGISLSGDVLIRDTSSQLIWAASEAWGDGNFAMRKLTEFPGRELMS